MQFQVPQNIDMEDKIVGPLTLIQFLYLIIGGIIAYLIFLATKGSYIFWLTGMPIGLFALAMAFLKIQDQPISYFVKAGLIYLSKPKVRIWQRHGLVLPVVQNVPKKVKTAPIQPKKKVEKSELEKLAYMLDTSAGRRPVK